MKKQKLDQLFDLSIILEKIQKLEDQQPFFLHLTKRPVYQDSNKSYVMPPLNDKDIRQKFKQIKLESTYSYKPLQTHYCKPFLQCVNTKNNVTSKTTDLLSKQQTPVAKTYQIKQFRSRSYDYKCKLQKTESIEIDAEFNVTRNLIRKFDKMQYKKVRFNILT